MFEIGIIEIILGVLSLCTFYYVVGTSIFQIKLTKRRGADHLKRLKPLVLLASYIGFVFIMVYFRFISLGLCFLYGIIFLVMVVAVILFYREDSREDFTNNLAMVIDEIKNTGRFDTRDFLIPDLTFTAKNILKYGPKKAARLNFILGFFLMVSVTYLFYIVSSDNIIRSIFIIQIVILSIMGLRGYKKSVRISKTHFGKLKRKVIRKITIHLITEPIFNSRSRIYLS